ncbi:unnamed protein product, partial [Iphiclides podalirius]
MGTNSSKSINETAGHVQKNDLNVEVNPDPRSPTPEIARTPLQSKNGLKHNITKNVDLRKTFESGQAEEKLIHNNPILSAVIKNHLQSYDPRSPTQEFERIERTPIVVAKAEEVASLSNVEEMSDDVLIKVLQSKSAEQPNDANGLLVYEDDTIVTETPKKAISHFNQAVWKKAKECKIARVTRPTSSDRKSKKHR